MTRDLNIMGFFKRHQRRGSYDLFSNYNQYMPGYGGMFIIFALFLLGSLLGSLLVTGLTLAISPDFAAKYGTLLSYPVSFIPAMLYASVQSRMANPFATAYALDSNNFGKHGGFVISLIAAAATFAAAFIVEPVVVLLPEMPQWLKDAMDQILKNCPFWCTLLSVSVFAPLFEEWLCRGLILRGLLKKSSPATAITVSAAFFAVLHMNPWQAIPAFCLGLLFGYVYYRTGSLKLTMLMHCVNNTVAAVFSQIPMFEEAESFMDVMSPWAYVCAYIALVLVLASAVVIFKGIPLKKEDGAGNCDEISPMSI